MREVLENIYRIQELDTAIRGLEEQRTQVPKEVERLDAELGAAQAELERIGSDQQAQAKHRRTLEQQVEDATLTIKKYQRQVYEVKTNKEYTAMLHEIEQEKSKVSRLEEEILTLMELAEKAATQEREARKKLDAVAATVSERKAELAGQARDLEAQTGRADASRAELLKLLPAEILATYQRISKGRNGIAVVPMVGGACGGCFVNLPTKLTVHIRSMEELVTCEACGRILIWRDPAPEAANQP